MKEGGREEASPGVVAGAAQPDEGHGDGKLAVSRAASSCILPSSVPLGNPRFFARSL